GGRPRHLQGQAGDHQLPQGDPPAAARPSRPRELHAAIPRARRRPRELLRRHRRRPRADLGHARELQGGHRGSRGHKRVGAQPSRQRDPPGPDRDQRHRSPADPDREHLGHERGRSRRGELSRLLGRDRGDGGDPRRDAQLLPAPPLAVSGPAQVDSVNVGRPKLLLINGQPNKTGIDKQPTDGPVELRDDAVAGDAVVDREYHGGYDKAVYAYASEDYAWWSGELGRELGPGAFGENLTTSGIAIAEAR